jgi:hypothetical protein
LLSLFVAQGIFSDFEPPPKTFDSSTIFLSLFSGCLAGFELVLQRFGAVECI